MKRCALQFFFCALIVSTLSTYASAQGERRFRTTAPGMTIKFQNLRPDASSVPAYITFGGAGALDATNAADRAPLTKGVSYELSYLSGGVEIRRFDSGKVFVSLGKKMQSVTEQTGYSGNFDNPTLDDFRTRWDKIEFTFSPAGSGSVGGPNLSSADFFGIPLDISITGGTRAPTHLTWHADTASVTGCRRRWRHLTTAVL
jgi:hypothetical protein